MGQEIVSLYKALEESLISESLSSSVQQALRLSRLLGDREIEKWLRLELGGYTNKNPAITNDTRVPEYRKVYGQHKDIYGHPLLLEPRLQFFNEYYLRSGIEELEKLAKGSKPTVIDENMINSIREMLNVEVYCFEFSPTSITGIFTTIKIKLEDWRYNVRLSKPELMIGLSKYHPSKESDNNRSVNVHIGGSVSNSNISIGDAITSSINIVESSNVPNELKTALRKLTTQISLITDKVTEEHAKEIARDLQMFTVEATSDSPRKKIWRLSLDELIRTAKTLGEIGKPILEISTLIISLLSKK